MPRTVLGVDLNKRDLSLEVLHLVPLGVGAPVPALVTDLARAIAAARFVECDLSLELANELFFFFLRKQESIEIRGRGRGKEREPNEKHIQIRVTPWEESLTRFRTTCSGELEIDKMKYETAHRFN